MKRVDLILMALSTRARPRSLKGQKTIRGGRDSVQGEFQGELVPAVLAEDLERLRRFVMMEPRAGEDIRAANVIPDA